MVISSTEGFENLISSLLSSNMMWKVSLICCLLVLKTLKDLETNMKETDIWKSSAKNLIRSFEMSFNNSGLVLSVTCSGYSFSPVCKSHFIIEVDKNAISEFSTIVSSEFPGQNHGLTSPFLPCNLNSPMDKPSSPPPLPPHPIKFAKLAISQETSTNQ
ncbi:hypothetical protein Tco_0149314 [Tanacetum coccineum]